MPIKKKKKYKTKDLRNNQKDILEINNNDNIVIEMKIDFDGLISRVGISVERISVLENTSLETFRTKKQK